MDMPWLLQPDHPAVMIYQRRELQADLDLERLYALGIDAFRIALVLLAGKAEAALDGVTGRLTLGGDRQFTRGLTTAQFSDGKLTVVRERP
jgi:outer membrane PBP1 activator LpoA protein